MITRTPSVRPSVRMSQKAPARSVRPSRNSRVRVCLYRIAAPGVHDRQGERNMLIHVHTSSFTFTLHQPNAAPAFREITRDWAMRPWCALQMCQRGKSLTAHVIQPAPLYIKGFTLFAKLGPSRSRIGGCLLFCTAPTSE